MCVVIFIFALILPFAAIAQPANVNRTLCNFDFEERRLGKRQRFPMNWVKIEGDRVAALCEWARLTDDRAAWWQIQFSI